LAKKGNNKGAGAGSRLNGDQVVKIARLTGCKNFVDKRKKFIFNAFVDLKPMKRFENWSDMCGFRSLDNTASKRVLDLLKLVKLTVWKVMIEKIAVVKFRMDNGGCNGALGGFSSSAYLVDMLAGIIGRIRLSYHKIMILLVRWPCITRS